MTEPLALDEASFFDFISQEQPSVVFLRLHNLHPFNATLPARVATACQLTQVNFGSLELPELVLKRSPILPFIHNGLADLAAPRLVLPGYYCYAQGILQAWDSGLPVRADAGWIAKAAALGVLWYGVTGNRWFIGSAAHAAADHAAAQRIAVGFAAALSNRANAGGAARPAGSAPSQRDLHWAYGVLGVQADASDAEVQAAWRRLRVLHHPDRAVNDPREYERRLLLSRQVNQARDLILRARGERGSQAA